MIKTTAQLELEREQEKDRQRQLLTERTNLLTSLIEGYPLYKSVELVEFYPNDVSSLHGITFNYFCENDNSNQTFELQLVQAEFFAVADPMIRNEGQILNFTEYFSATCSKCKHYKMQFLINAYGKKPKLIVAPGTKQNSFFVRKIGQYPPYDRKPDKETMSYLTKEDVELYGKALMNLSTSFGIGALAYFRRIVENEIKKMINDIAELNFDGAVKVKEAIEKFNKDHQMANLISVLTTYLPDSLKVNGDNPIKVIYEKTSEGLHGLSDEKCAEYAISVDILLQFVIKQLNREKNEFNSVKNALKNLKM